MGASRPLLLLFFFYFMHCSCCYYENSCELKSMMNRWHHHHHHHHHKWVSPTGHHTITVDASGSADFLSIQDAIDSIPDHSMKKTTIRINAGVYIEKVLVPATKPYISFHGAGRDATVVEWHDRASDRGSDGHMLRTYNTASVTVYANYFSAKNISFKNTAPAPWPGMEGWQAAAFRISGDKAYFSGCGFYGAQDTLCDDAGRHYFTECYIEGSIDFIFGNGRSMYKSCQLHSIATRFGSIAAHGRKSPCDPTGFTFFKCRVTGTGPLYVGRAMGQYSRIVYSYTYFDNVVAHSGWDDWDHTSNKNRTPPAYVAVRGYVTLTTRMHGVSCPKALSMGGIGLVFQKHHEFLISFQENRFIFINCRVIIN